MLRCQFYHYIVRHQRIVWRICAMVLSVLIACAGLPLFLNTDAHQRVDIQVADGFVGSRDWEIEQTPQQLAFRWVPTGVTIPIPLWSPMMLWRSHTWLHPEADTATLHVGRLNIPLQQNTYQYPRYVHLLLAPETATRITAGITIAAGTPRWAFTTMQLTPTQPYQVLPPIWVSWLLSWAVITLILVRWWPAYWHWDVLGATMVTTVVFVQLPPIGQTVHNLWHLSSLNWGIAGTIFIGILCWWVPNYLRWMRHTAHVQRFVIASYTMLTIVPIGFTFFHQEINPWGITENRKLAPWPRWQDPIQYSADAEAWLMDHIGLRSLMIRTKNELDYRVLRSSQRVYFGKDDHLFIRRWTDERLPALTRIFESPQQRTALIDKMTEQVAWYEAQGLTCYVVIAPSKESIYPEYLPWYVPPTSYQQVLDFEAELRQHGIRVVPTYDILQQTKPNVPQLYYPQDFHWNRIAAYYVGQYILTDLPRYRPANPVALPIITVNQSPTPIHNRTFAALLSDYLPYPISYEGRIDIDVQRSKVAKPGGNLITYPADMPVLYPQQSLLIVGDSFSARLHDAGFAGGFSTIYRTGRPRDRAAFANWLASTNITTVVWQLRDMSLPLYLADQEEQ